MKVYFSWDANTDGLATGYKIYAGSATGTYDHPASPRDVGNTTYNYFDIDTYGTPIFFSLTAYNVVGESGFSTEVQMTYTRPVVVFRR